MELPERRFGVVPRSCPRGSRLISLDTTPTQSLFPGGRGFSLYFNHLQNHATALEILWGGTPVRVRFPSRAVRNNDLRLVCVPSQALRRSRCLPNTFLGHRLVCREVAGRAVVYQARRMCKTRNSLESQRPDSGARTGRVAEGSHAGQSPTV